jgi:Spy/CpxP family protein refolding chaperone
MKTTNCLKLTGLAFLISLSALNISAQGPGGGPGRGFQMSEEDIKERVEQTAKTLELNDEQHKKVLAVEMDFYNKMQIEFQKMRNAGGPPAEGGREAMREKMMKMRDDRNAAYEEVLSPEQYKKFIASEEQRRQEMRQQRQQNPPAEGAEQRPERGRGRN